MKYTLEQLKQILRQAGWPEELIPTMAAIGMAESSGNPNAYNPGAPGQRIPERSVGIWQINTLAHTEFSVAALRDPVYNAKAALAVYRKQGFRAWSVYLNGAYKKFLDGVRGVIPSIPTSVPEMLSGGVLSYFTDPVPTAAERFAPFLSSPKRINANSRMMIATGIVMLIIVFAWREF